MDGKEELERIVDELVDGGYYSARSQSLSPLDKLTGGLAWCITAISDDVDFDLFYDAGATLGYKIKVGEAIEAALRKMECPHPLQGHQILNLDYSAVYPVVQWLVKHIIMTQGMLTDELRRLSRWRLNKEHGFVDDRDSGMKHQGKTTLSDPLNHQPQLIQWQTKDPTIGLCLKEAQVLEAQTVESQDLQLTDALASHQEQAVALWKQLSEEEKNNHILQQERQNLNAQMSKKDEYRKNQENKVSQRLLEIDMLNKTVESGEAGELLERLLLLAEQYQMMQEEDVNLHYSYKKKHEELLGSIQDVERKVDLSKGGDDRKTEVENTLKRDYRQLEILREDLAKKNQEFLSYRRKSDETPCQSELMQYERCFVELDVHIQAKLQETRRYFATYNALADANELTLKEISLLNSINVQFEEAMMSQDGRTKFVASMNNIAKGVHRKVEKMEAAFLSEQNTLSQLKERHHRLVAEQRQYDSLMKLFQEECARNEVLRSSVFQSK